MFLILKPKDICEQDKHRLSSYQSVCVKQDSYLNNSYINLQLDREDNISFKYPTGYIKVVSMHILKTKDEDS